MEGGVFKMVGWSAFLLSCCTKSSLFTSSYSKTSSSTQRSFSQYSNMQLSSSLIVLLSALGAWANNIAIEERRIAIEERRPPHIESSVSK